MKRKRTRTSRKSPYVMDDGAMLCEAVRLHYLSLEGGGPDVYEEALFFLEWHYSNCEGMG